jgi:hypothetical protein
MLRALEQLPEFCCIQYVSSNDSVSIRRRC